MTRFAIELIGLVKNTRNTRATSYLEVQVHDLYIRNHETGDLLSTPFKANIQQIKQSLLTHLHGKSSYHVKHHKQADIVHMKLFRKTENLIYFFGDDESKHCTPCHINAMEGKWIHAFVQPEINLMEIVKSCFIAIETVAVFRNFDEVEQFILKKRPHLSRSILTSAPGWYQALDASGVQFLCYNNEIKEEMVESNQNDDFSQDTKGSDVCEIRE